MKRLRDSVVKWLVFSLLCLLFGFLLGKFKQDMLENKLAVITLNFKKMEIRNAKLETKQSRLDIVLVAEQQTIKSLLQSNKQLQEQVTVANNKLYFYEGVLAPENEITGVKVHSFEVTQNEQKGFWNYELVLMQSQQDRRLLHGQFNIFLSVFEDQNFKLVALSELSGQESSSFKFKYFQTIQGSFLLADEMSVDEIIVKLAVTGNRWYKEQNIEQHYDWRVLSSKDNGDLGEFSPVTNIEE